MTNLKSMKMAYLNDRLAALCWEEAKCYFRAMDRSHISRMIEHSIVNKHADTEEPQGAE